MDTRFSKISRETWKLSTEIDWGCTCFEDLVEKIVRNFNIYSLKRNQLKESPGFYRVQLKIRLPAELVNAFHNSEFGYRAQYYSGEETGERANRFIIEHLCPSLLDKIEEKKKSTCKLDWAADSLASPDAKIWIHQGSWLRKNERSNRRLEVGRWTGHINDLERNIAKKAQWSRLVPHEDKLDIKGGFILLDGSKSKPNPKSDRAKQIHEYGFT